jgi:hypothetical protein
MGSRLIIEQRPDLLAYRANPVVLAFHDYRSLPVAKTVSISQVGDSLIATAESIGADVSPFADQCFRMPAGGVHVGVQCRLSAVARLPA